MVSDLARAGFNQKRPGQACIYYTEVDATHRGHGYGRALPAVAADHARRHSARTIGLHVFTRNKAARALYESTGCEATQ
jgi:ribosomal protein S18 acetylase RimI-like enzyme